MGRKKGGIGMGGKNGGTSMVRIGMSIETREGREWVRKDGHGREKRMGDKGGRKERRRRKKTSLTCQCTAFPPGVLRPAGPLAPC